MAVATLFCEQRGRWGRKRAAGRAAPASARLDGGKRLTAATRTASFACSSRRVGRVTGEGPRGRLTPGLNHLPVVPQTVKTPTGVEFPGVGFEGRICGVSIMRGASTWWRGPDRTPHRSRPPTGS